MGVMLLLNHVLFQVGLEAIPPVTLLIVLAQACTFLQLFEVPWRGLSGACISVDAVIFKKQWLRIFYGAIEHGDSLHLYYNMVSFIWKGMLLEPVLGSAQFAYVIVLFTALCGSVLLGLNYLLGTFVNTAFYYQCAVGFSGVIFALKVLNNCYFPGRSRRLFGVDINLPAGQVVWLELVLIQLVTPNASLVGHLAGILVGLAYVYGVITPVSDLVWNLLGQQPTRLTRTHYGPLGRRRESGGWSGQLAAMPFGAILVSAALVALQADIVPRDLKPMVDAPCLASSLVIDHHQWKLLLVPALHASGLLHLAYTVLTLVGLGYYLEHRMGILRFLSTLLALTVLTNVAFCVVTYYVLPNYKEVAGVRAFEMQYKCFVGLTAALIAMKGVYIAHYPTGPYLFLFLRVHVPKLLGIIFEFALLHFVLPHVWIVGNAIGFFAAFVYVILS